MWRFMTGLSTVCWGYTTAVWAEHKSGDQAHPVIGIGILPQLVVATRGRGVRHQRG